MTWNWIAVVTLLAVYVLHRIPIVVHGFKCSKQVPRIHCLFSPLHLPGVLLPTTWWNPGISWIWKWRLHSYKSRRTELVCYVPWLAGVPTMFSTNLDVARQTCVGGTRSAWIKPVEASLAVLRWGMNLLASEGEVWRKHRRIMGPAFNNDLYNLVWSESQATLKQMMRHEGWLESHSIDIPIFQTIGAKFALIIIGKCGFGFNFTWAEPPAPPGAAMPIQEALQILSEDHLIAEMLPQWIISLPFKKFRKIREARTQLEHFMNAQVAERKVDVANGVAENKRDAFTMLVRANEGESGKLQLSDQELIGNVFIMLFAGHETTANTLATTLGLLSLHDDVQEEVYQQITSVVGHNREPEIDDYPNLDKVLAIFYEALRLFPAGPLLMRSPVEDTILQVPRYAEEGVDNVHIPKGLWLSIDMIGVQYNPRYYDNPTEYRPSRWYGYKGEGDLLSAFSIGPRACIGRKFAALEAVSFLTSLLREWRVEPLLKDGKTKQEWRDRVLDGKLAMVLGCNDVPLRFVRRR